MCECIGVSGIDTKLRLKVLRKAGDPKGHFSRDSAFSPRSYLKIGRDRNNCSIGSTEVTVSVEPQSTSVPRYNGRSRTRLHRVRLTCNNGAGTSRHASVTR